ncbi:MAG: hypothetical protein ORN56_00775 [Chitinophagales bacterium]|nr:hypothetical protein [Chitinophagales bacterium]
MKRLFIALALLVSTSLVNAQPVETITTETPRLGIAKGTVLLGGVGGINFSTAKAYTNMTSGTTISGPRTTSFAANFSPNVGIFLFRNFAMGLKLRADYNSSRVEGFNKTVNTIFNVGPFLRYYNPLSPKLLLFYELQYGMGRTVTNAGTATATKVRGNVLSFGPGFTYLINPNVGIEALLTYENFSSVTNLPTGTVTKNVYRGNYIRFNVGVQMYLK